MDRYLISQSGIWITFIFVLLLVGKYFFNFKPKFVLPKRHRDHGRLAFVIVKYLFVFGVILLPLQVQYLVGKTLEVRKVVPVQILFDVSLSMTADDISPSRFEAAKLAVMSMISALDEYDISLITFSGVPFVYMPFSQDTASMLEQWTDTDMTDFPPDPEFVGTAIGDALLLAMDNFLVVDEEDKQPGVIVLITDGDSNMGYDPVQVLPWLQKAGMPVFTLGVGEEEYLIGSDHFGTPVMSSLNVDLLRQIAEDTGGEFYRILDEKNFFPVFEEIVQVVRAQEEEEVVNQYWELNSFLYRYVLILGVAFLSFRVYYLRQK